MIVEQVKSTIDETMEKNPVMGDKLLEEFMGQIVEKDKNYHKNLSLKVSDKEFKDNFIRSIMETSLLISSALIFDEDDDDENYYEQVKKYILSKAKQDSSEVQVMRNFYLTEVVNEELDEIISSDEEKELFEKRVNEFSEVYNIMHSK